MGLSTISDLPEHLFGECTCDIVLYHEDIPCSHPKETQTPLQSRTYVVIKQGHECMSYSWNKRRDGVASCLDSTGYVSEVPLAIVGTLFRYVAHLSSRRHPSVSPIEIGRNDPPNKQPHSLPSRVWQGAFDKPLVRALLNVHFPVQ
jgi:hypothetical protein